MQGNILNKKSLYIHIPFCASKCSYCAFYSVTYDNNLSSSYIDVISKEINSLRDNFYTVYIGGGTPTVLAIKQLKELFAALKKFSQKAHEFTIEANPESLDNDKISLFLDSGIRRISIGAQSFSDNKLKRLGRVHDSENARDCARQCARKGFENISIDLIFGLPGETLESWKNDLEETCTLPVKHVSCYSLTYEKDLHPADEDTTAEMYKYAISYLKRKGFDQYEISNFAKKGYRCRHNMRYWEGDEYKGVGPSAVSYEDGVRIENISSMEEYMRRIKNSEPVISGKEKLLPEARAKELAAVKIRTMDGIGLEWFREKTGFEFLILEKEAVCRLIENNLIKCNDKKINLTPRGVLCCDVVSGAFL